MRKVMQQPAPKKLKHKKPLKFLSAISMVLPMFMGTMEDAHAAREVDTPTQNVTIQKRNISVHFSQVSRKGYGQDYGLVDRLWDNDGDTFYCLDPSKYSPTGTITYGGEANNRVRAILRAGVGGANIINADNDEGYEATQLAIWMASGGIDNISWNDGAAGTSDVKNMYNQLMAAADDANWQSDGASTLQIDKVGDVKNDQKTYYAQDFKISGNGLGDTIQINVQGADGITITQDGQTVSNNQVKPNDNFEVKVPYNFDKGGQSSVTVSASTDSRRAVAAEYNPSGNSQRTTTLYSVKSTPINASTSFSFEHTNKYSPRAFKKSDEGTALKGVKFGVFADDNGKPGKLVKELTTDEKGAINIDGITAGTYWLVEESTIDGYELNQTPTKFTVNEDTPNPNLGNIINNHMSADVGTTATNQEDGTKTLQPIHGDVTINDKVAYKHVFVGKKYKLEGTLMDKATGKQLMVDGKPVVVTKEFTPTTTSGTIDMPFTVDAASLAGKNVVVYETLIREDNTKYTTKHQNINDEGQTVKFTSPSIHTTATNNEDGSKTLQPLNNDNVKDVVSYTDLIPGKKYTMKGTLMDKTTGKPVEVNGKTVTAQQEFTPTKASGSVEMHFNVNATQLKGKNLVAFETAYYGNSELVDHQNINDEGQTVKVTSPSLHTTLTGDNSQKTITPSTNNTLTDTVTYNDLVPGKKYTITGKLMDKQTKQPVISNGKQVTTTATFTPQKASGTTNVKFQFDGTQYKGHSLVAYEAVDYNGQEIANHEDINDTAQTVNMDVDHPAPITNTPSSSSVLPQTNNGQASWLAETIGTAAMIVTVGSAVRFVRRHDSGLDD